MHTAQVGTCSCLCAESWKVLSRHFRENAIHVPISIFPQYGGTSEKLRVRKNVVVTKNLQTRLGQQCTQLQFGMLFIIVQNLEIF